MNKGSTKDAGIFNTNLFDHTYPKHHILQLHSYQVICIRLKFPNSILGERGRERGREKERERGRERRRGRERERERGGERGREGREKEREGGRERERERAATKFEK